MESLHRSLTATTNVFGTANDMDSKILAWSFVIIVVIVVLLEKFIAIVNRLTYETPFQDMVSSVMSELMVVGIMSFSFKILMQQTNVLSPTWAHALDFAGNCDI
jgi:hypothetical protein